MYGISCYRLREIYETHRPWKNAVSLCCRRRYVWLPGALTGLERDRECVCVCARAKACGNRNTCQCLRQLPIVKILRKSQGVCLDRKYQRLVSYSVARCLYLYVTISTLNSFSSLQYDKLTCDVNMTPETEKA